LLCMAGVPTAPPSPPEESVFADGIGAALAMGLFVGIGITMVLNMVLSALISAMDQKTLRSDAAVQVDASVMSTSTQGDGYGGVSAYIFHYEFFLPAPRSRSALQKMGPMGGIGRFGARVTGAMPVTREVFESHIQSVFPKDCTVRYVSANPRRSEIVAIGADNDPAGHMRSKAVPKLAGLVFNGIFLVVPVIMTAQMWPDLGSNAVAAFFALVGAMVVLSLGCAARTAARQPFLPGCTRCDPLKDAKITNLDAPYEKPLAAVPAAVPTAATATTMMAVTCPDGVAPGQTIQIALPNGSPMQVQVPPGVAPKSVFQVAVPATPVVSKA